jgi:hypothetical protein
VGVVESEETVLIFRSLKMLISTVVQVVAQAVEDDRTAITAVILRGNPMWSIELVQIPDRCMSRS